MTRYTKAETCRICGSTELTPVLDLGHQYLTGVFPRTREEPLTAGPLQLVKCQEPAGCGLLQLAHSYDLAEMYGANYGYRSGLNVSMVTHLRDKVRRILAQVELREGDLVLDIGSNDGTTLGAYPSMDLTLVGMDPSAGKFRKYYPSQVRLIEDFFSASRFKDDFGDAKARVVTSFAMFYDLEQPMEFMRQVHEILADDGIWVFEQSYMPSMLEVTAYDTVCQEHLEFYGLRQIKWMTDRVGFHILDVELNDVNGGSFSVTVQKSHTDRELEPQVQRLLEREADMGLDTIGPYEAFAERAEASRSELVDFVRSATESGKSVAALGASTKGNVLLQYCGFTEKDIFAIGEVNDDKFGAVTPGTWIPIVPEKELLAQKPDYLLILPWHFRRFFVESGHFSGFSLVFPLPKLEVIEI